MLQAQFVAGSVREGVVRACHLAGMQADRHLCVVYLCTSACASACFFNVCAQQQFLSEGLAYVCASVSVFL